MYFFFNSFFFFLILQMLVNDGYSDLLLVPSKLETLAVTKVYVFAKLYEIAFDCSSLTTTLHPGTSDNPPPQKNEHTG